MITQGFSETVNRERKPPSSPGSWLLIKNRCASCVFTLPFYYRSFKYTEEPCSEQPYSYRLDYTVKNSIPVLLHIYHP